MNTPECIETDRLNLRRPKHTDADNIFSRYASDPDVTKMLGWPRHRTVEDTRGFLEWCDAEWKRTHCGTYLVKLRENGRLLGSTGISISAFKGETGYVLARDSWGFGYATEALRAMVGLARTLGLKRLAASVHPSNPASIHVLEKCGFEREALLRSFVIFPNLDSSEPADILSYAIIF